MKLKQLVLIALVLLTSLENAFTQTVVSIPEKTKQMKAFKGFIDFYWEEATGKIWLQLNKFDTEFLYQTSLPAGLGSNDVGLDGGSMGAGYVVKFNRIGNKVLMVQSNYAFRAETGSPAEKKAVAQSFAQSTIWGFTISAESNGAVLVDATEFLLRDAIQVSSRLQQMNQGNFGISESRSALFLERTKNFPLNTEFESSVTFVNNMGDAGNFVSTVAPTPESFTLRIHHSFVQLPDNNYKPRVCDPRSPFGAMSYFDFSTPVSSDIQKYFIERHRLQKKDPTAAKSEAVKPIIYYLDNATPEPIRSALMEGASWWNQAFEAAGYINAFQVKILPDSVDPMDLRYNVINWVHRSTRGYSYGASITDPRTGEIIKGNVTLGSLRVRQDYLIAQGLLAPFANGEIPADNKMLQMALQRLKQLAAHEVGHTLGLMHNYISSTQNRASVMDYPPPVAFINDKNEIDLSNAYTNQIGDWDKISITYGYQEFDKGVDEKAALDKIILDAVKSGLTFISDRDARDEGGFHPKAHLWDVNEDVVQGLKEVMKVRAKALSQFGENNILKGTSMSKLEDVLVPIYLFHRYQIEATIKKIGGMNYTYATRGDGQLITQPIPKEEQVAALNAVMECMDPNFLALPESIIKLIPPRPAIYDYTKELFKKRTGNAFDPLAAAETAADMPLLFLFNASRLNRMVEYQQINKGLGVDEMVKLLIAKTWKASPLQGLPGLIQRQNEQLLLTYLLALSVDTETSFATKAQLLLALDELKTFVTANLKTTKDTVYKGYLLLTLDRMKAPEKAIPTQHEAAPPGAPIGCGAFGE